jgi:hypothetical protein
MKIHVIVVAYERMVPLEILVKCFQVQTNPDWVLHIVHDGPAPEQIIQIMGTLIKDSRVIFYQSEERYQNYGHPNRRTMLQTIECDAIDYILMTNDDNYYTPRFVEFMFREVKPNIGIIYCDTVHSHFEYTINISSLVENGIDIGAFIVRADIAKMTGFNYDHFSADGKYAEECVTTCTQQHLGFVKINKPLFIHN